MKKSSNFILKNYKESWNFFKKFKIYILASVCIFVFFSLIGFIFPIFFREEIFEFLKQILLKFEGLNLYETVFYIFLNNFKASFFAVILGIALGIFPLVVAIINGYVLGFVSRNVVSEEGFLILWRILPHGIFELPAVLMSIGIGLKIGADVLIKKYRKNLKKDFFSAFKFFIFVIIPLLIIAAVIEGFLVFYLK